MVGGVASAQVATAKAQWLFEAEDMRLCARRPFHQPYRPREGTGFDTTMALLHARFGGSRLDR